MLKWNKDKHATAGAGNKTYKHTRDKDRQLSGGTNAPNAQDCD